MRLPSFIFNSRFLLLAIIFFLLFYIALGRIYEYAGQQNVINHYNRQRFEEFYKADPDSIDWLFMGSSHSYCTFDPKNFLEYDISSYQMGMPLQLLDGTYYTLLEALNYQQPETIVLELYWYVLELDFDAKQMEMLFQVMHNVDIKKQYLQEVLPWNEKIKYYLKPVRYQTDFIAFVNKKLLNVIKYRFGLSVTEEYRPGTEYYRDLGYVVYDYVLSERQINEVLTSPVKEMYGWQMAPKQAYYLDKIVELCDQKGIELVLTTAPVSNVQLSRLRNYSAFHTSIAGYAEGRGLPYLDFNMVNINEGLFGNEHFFDAGHLNVEGAAVANEYFMDWYNSGMTH